MVDTALRQGDDPVAYRVAETVKALERGWVPTPMKGKRPLLKGWTKADRPDRATVETWARHNNTGIRTGSVSRLAVIDDDTDDGSAEKQLNLPMTVTVTTGSGKRHHYFRVPEGVTIRNSTSRLAPNVDVRGEGGVVVAVGSIHPETNRAYEWAPGRSPDEVDLADLPPEIVARLTRKGASKNQRFAPGGELQERLRIHAQKVCDRQADELARAPEGRRNDILNRASFMLGRLVGAGVLERDRAEEAMRTAATAAGLDEREIESTLRSGLDAGIADPHDLKALARQAAQAGVRSAQSDRPTILVQGGCLPDNVDAAEQALLNDGGPQLYQRENLLVRMTRSLSVQLDDGTRRPQGALVLTLIELPYLVERLTRAASFEVPVSSGGTREIDCTQKIAATYLARKGNWTVPVLRAVIEAPTLRPDGSILQEPGYDVATQLYFDAGGVTFEPVPENPTRDMAIKAIAKIKKVIEGFPFVADCDRSVALAAILTGLVRRSLRTAPLFAFRAPKMASGKSLLADVVGMFATGRPVPAMPQGKDEDEDRKRMLALLVEGDPVLCIDNVERPLESSALCSILTQTTFKDRILGRTGTATVPTCTTWLATGNNLVIVGDLTTRALVCDLDPGVERPEEREFEVNLYEYVPAHRGELVAAALTVLRAYHVAGRPRQKLSVFGRFESWSNLVRSALVWCGEADPNETRRRIEYVDPVRRQLEGVLLAWHGALADQQVTAAGAIAVATSGSSPFRDALREALVEALGGTITELTAMKLGNWLAKYERRPEAGLRIERAGNRQGSGLWMVCRV